FAAAYVMQHMTGSIPPEFDGTIADVYETETNALTDELTSVFSFEKNLNDACETLNLKPVKKKAEFTEGKVGSAIRFTGDYYLNLGKPESLTNSRKDFTLTFWFRADGSIDNDPPFISNKNWENGLNPGIVVAANYSKPGNNATFNLGDGKIRDDLNPLTYEPGQWYFFAVTVDRDANAVFYLGDSAGKLAFISDDISEQGSFDSGLDWNLGQDGTGNYPATLTGVMDELGIWGRPLRQNEIQAVYQLGLNGQSLTK
ncbi:MAG: LamG domain-containing protein, partial [Thermoguttaceae bacterium]|nr:LamG domain-containing protein [Thermoguttaceae bacterium]